MSKKKPKISMGSRATLRAVSDGDDTGRHRWRLEWYPQGAGGKMRTRSLGPRGWRGTAAEAERQARELLLDLDLDAQTAPEPEPTGEYTVEDLLQLWLGALKMDVAAGSLSQRSYDIKFDACKRLLGGKVDDPDSGPPRLRYVSVGALTHDRIRQHLVERRDSAPATIRLDCRMLREAWRWGQRQDYAPARELIMPKMPKAKAAYTRYTPTPAEAERTLAAMTLPLHRGAYQLIWGTGARVTEAATCRPDWDAGTISLDGKTGPRRIPMTPRARAGLNILLNQVPELAGRRPGEVMFLANTIRSAIKDAARRAGVPHHSPHGLRRLACDEMRRAGVPLEIAAQCLGHSIEMMLEVYRRPSDEEVRAALERSPIGGNVLPFPAPKSATG